LEEILNGYLNRYGQKSRMLSDVIHVKLLELRSPTLKAKLISEEFRARDREKLRREKQNTASGIMLFEETKSPMIGGKRSSS